MNDTIVQSQPRPQQNRYTRGQLIHQTRIEGADNSIAAGTTVSITFAHNSGTGDYYWAWCCGWEWLAPATDFTRLY